MHCLPAELCERIAEYFEIQFVDMEHVVATGCSSQQLNADGKPLIPLSACLTEDENTFWISGEGLDVRSQYVEFSVTGPGSTVCRLRAVSIKIPPLPHGPLSVRDFIVQAGDETTATDDDWESLTPVLTAANRTGWQRFVLESVDVRYVRILCLTNQLGAFGASIGDAALRRNEKVGFYSIKFE